MMKPIAATALLLTATSVHAEPVLGSYAITFAGDRTPGGFVQEGPLLVTSTSGSVITSTAAVAPNASALAQSQAQAWLNRGLVNATATGDSLVIGASMSSFAINQRVEGAVGTSARISYTFGIEGNLVPGSDANYAIDPTRFPQNVFFALLGTRGTALGFDVVETSEFTDVRFIATGGQASLLVNQGEPGYVDTLADDIIPGGLGFACFGLVPGCAPSGTIDATLTIDFDVVVDEDFYVSGTLISRTNGLADFFNTARLLSIELTPGYSLVSDDGGVLRRLSDGTYVLAEVPEPAALSLFGLGILGVGLARRRHKVV